MIINPIVIEQTFVASPERLWKALTDYRQIKQWYLDLPDFKPEVGFEFENTVNKDDRSYHQFCKITRVIENKLLAYSWRYDTYPGDSEVIFELFKEGNSVRLVLTHEGTESFPNDNPDFVRERFIQGWDAFINYSLKTFLEKNELFLEG